jgi:hypothetical protein
MGDAKGTAMNRRGVMVTALGGTVVGAALYAAYDSAIGKPRAARLDATCGAADAGAIVTDKGVAPTSSSANEDAWLAANQNLAQTVSLYKERLAANEAEKQTIATRLKQAEAKLAAAENDGALPRNEFDLTKDDWAELAKQGTVKARYPCGYGNRFQPTADQLRDMGLTASDTPALAAALAQSDKRMWEVIAPLCTQIVGRADLAERLGANVCISIVAGSVEKAQAHSDDQRLVAEIRAGMRAMPPDAQLDPFAKILLAQTGAMATFENDLAKSFGPDDAHRIAFDEHLGMCSGTYGGAPPRGK